MPSKVHTIISLLTLCALAADAQVSSTDSIVAAQMRRQLARDTLPPLLSFPQGTSLPDSLRPPASPINWDSVKISPDALEDQVDYQARDSMFFDVKNKQIHLFGQAQVKFQTMTIAADYIVIDWQESTFSAEGRTLPSGEVSGKPDFSMDDQKFTAGRMKYNFKTYKGIIYEGHTQQEGMNVVGEKGKFFGTGGDSTRANVIYNRNAIFSTCDLDHPHFGIRSNKQKIVQDKVAVVGPCNLVIGDVPTPLWLPFGFFPLKLGARTGLIFPRNYEYSEAYGFGLEGVGWYFPLSQHMDLQVTSDIYLKGSLRVHGLANYRKRYKYNGQAGLSLSYLRSELDDGSYRRTPAMSVNWSHNQDSKAHPYRSFGGNIRLETGNYAKSNNADARSQLQSSLSSNMSYRQRFDKPFDLSAAFSHSQNTNTRQVTVSFPTFNFQTQNLFPFKRKVKSGKEAWYEKIQTRYTSEFRNQFAATDTTLFTKKTLKEAKYGMRHNVTLGTSFNLLKWFTVSPNANYKEVWYFKTLERTFDPTPVTKDTFVVNPADQADTTFIVDTLEFGQVLDMDNFGFKPFRQYDMGASMSTKIFGTVLFKKGWLRGLRHVITPTFGFTFSPDYTNPDWGYFKTVRSDLRTDELLTYSIFENNKLGGFDTPSPSSGKRAALNYGFSNLFEAKVFSKRDSTDKKIPLLRSLSVGGSYNFAADSMNWSEVRLSGNTSFFNGITSFRFGAVFDPYDRNPKTGARVNKFYLDEQGKLLRLASWDFGFNTTLTVARIRDLMKGVDSDQRANPPRTTSGVGSSGQRDVLTGNVIPNSGGEGGRGFPGAEEEVRQEGDFLSLFEDFNVSHAFNVRRAFVIKSGRDSVQISAHSIYTQGSIRLTDNWNINVGNFGYDFQSKQVTYPDFGFSRDLHCWEMGVFWQPDYGTYSFYLRVKPGKLDFINVPYQKRIQDRGAGF